MLMAFLMAIPGVAAAQPGPPPPEETAADRPPPGDGGRFSRGGPREEHRFTDEMGNPVDPRELLEQVMTARLSKELALDEQQTVTLVRRFSEFREEMHSFRMERMRLLRELRTVTRNAQDEEAINATLKALLELDETVARANRNLFETASSSYTPWQRARLYIFMSEFENDMRRMVQRARERFERRPDGEDAFPPSRWDRRDGFGPRGEGSPGEDGDAAAQTPESEGEQ